MCGYHTHRNTYNNSTYIVPLQHIQNVSSLYHAHHVHEYYVYVTICHHEYYVKLLQQHNICKKKNKSDYITFPPLLYFRKILSF